MIARPAWELESGGQGTRRGANDSVAGTAYVRPLEGAAC